MINMLKKIGICCISLFLVLVLTVNNVFSMMYQPDHKPPKINAEVFEKCFKDEYSRKMSGESGFITDPTNVQFGVPCLCYFQPGGTYDGEVRDVWVWNLPAVVCEGDVGICAILLELLKSANKCSESETDKYMKRGKTLLAAKGVMAASEYIAEAGSYLGEIANFLNFDPTKLINAFKKSQEFFKIAPDKLANILNNGIAKIYSGTPLFTSFSISLIGTALIVLGIVGCMLHKIATINQDERDIDDISWIIEKFLWLVGNKCYYDNNIVVMAKDNTPIHFWNPWRSCEKSYIGFLECKALYFCAPKFQRGWPDDEETPQWAKSFTGKLEHTVGSLTTADGPTSIPAVLQTAKDSIEYAKKRAKDALTSW